MIDVLCTTPQDGPVLPTILMVSGGSDSTALLVMAAVGELDLCDGRGPRRLPRGELRALHVNHCLRGDDSDGDERFVRDLCRELGVACRVARVDVAAVLAQKGGNLEETAREARYRAAGEYADDLAREFGVGRACARVLVAHTADDRAETFLMRAMTGSAATGLAGMRRTRGLVVRPLLDWTRAQLRDYLVERGVSWREDATNALDDALRSYVRNRVVPGMVRRVPAFARTLSRSIDLLADEDDLLEELAGKEYAAAARPAPPGTVGLDADRLARSPRALARRVVRLALADALGEEGFRDARFERAHIEAAIDVALGKRPAATLPLATDVRLRGGKLVVSACGAPTAGVPGDAALPVPGEAGWDGSTVRAECIGVPAGVPAPVAAQARAGELRSRGLVEGRDFVIVDADALGDAATVGAPRAGERMEPFGLGVSKLVHDVLADAGVPGGSRPRVPVVRTASGGVAWAAGVRLDARVAYSRRTRRLVELALENRGTATGAA